MLAIIFRASLEGQLLKLLNKHGVIAYSEIYKECQDILPGPAPIRGSSWSSLMIVQNV
jgi:hypothetical protein